MYEDDEHDEYIGELDDYDEGSPIWEEIKARGSGYRSFEERVDDGDYGDTNGDNNEWRDGYREGFDDGFQSSHGDEEDEEYEDDDESDEVQELDEDEKEKAFWELTDGQRYQHEYGDDEFDDNFETRHPHRAAYYRTMTSVGEFSSSAVRRAKQLRKWWDE